jgi:hypothetical protein
MAKIVNMKVQKTSVSDPDPHSISFLDPEANRMRKIEGENEAKRQRIHHMKVILKNI